ncbi:hypothetical protein AB3Y40_01150 [Yoonia sp. R2331]|uniref:hypothetical protein n=1 Tax=Yoonia sp. R2331 TaxID=3237238 RepID=UPI0034E4E867
MRHLIRIVWVTVTGTAAMLCAAYLLVPATAAEQAALASEDRIALVQLRLARTLLTVAPDQTVTLLASRTGLPDDLVRAGLEAYAYGADTTPPVTPNRQTRAGGALFVTPD